MTIDPDGDGPAGFDGGDAVRLTLVAVQILNKDGTPTDELKVAKWQNAFEGNPPTVKANFIDLDPDRFAVQVADVSQNTDPNTKQKVTITLATDSPGTDYDDDATEIELEELDVDSGIFVSPKWLMLMSDDVDDDHEVDAIDDDDPNDRSHKIALDGVVQIRYPNFGTEVVATAKVKIQKKVSVEIIILRDKPLAMGGMPVIDPADVDSDWKIVAERYAQVGIAVEWAIDTEDPTAGINFVDGFHVASAANDKKVSDEAKDLIDDLGTTANSTDIQVFYIEDVEWQPGENLFGVAIADYWFDESEEDYINNIFMDIQRNKPFNPAHELAHLLTNSGGFGGNAEPTNVLNHPTSTMNTETATKRFTSDQENAMQGSPLVDDPS